LPFPSLVCPVCAHRSVSCAAGARRRRPEAPPQPRRSLSAPVFALEVSNLPMPLFRQVPPQCPHNSSSELIRAAVSPPRRVLRPPKLPRQRGTHGRVRHVALNALELFPKPLEPSRGRPPRLQRDLTVRPSGATAPASDQQPLDLGRRPRSVGLDLTRADLISALRSRSDCSPLSPSPTPLPLGPAGQPHPGSLTPRPRLSVTPARASVGSNLIR
jgi:hypothetical protein